MSDINDLYHEFKDIKPYCYLPQCNGLWYRINLSPIGRLIKNRIEFLDESKLTWREINAIKEKMDKIINNLENYRAEIFDETSDLVSKLTEQEKLCNSDSECAKKLDAHLKTCDECTKTYVAYYCNYKDNGRCEHYYDIKYINEKLDNFQYDIDQYLESYQDLEVIYDKVLAIKENRYEEYKRKMYDSDY